ncbi:MULTISPECIES: WD40/YVTN/BNR-like repeat-containing protein [Burkholderia cepacia complex]|uniref:WD40/YVTN/BNR-like repeat-containing protein n=1 Tax=Burkholderia cepacia complex TaxID=87882 RepID=UPI00264CD9AA|nr:glycosyl hydrolase [Burkholderia orbicola]MDN7778700.1 glycosyl hydrolase [Burkholderia orbicola]
MPSSPLTSANPMRNHSRLKRLAAIAIGSIALILLVENTGSRWETVSSKVTWPVPLAGVGDFYVVGNEIMSLTVADPVVMLKPPGEWKNPMVAEPTEAWMNNAAETLNRRTVNFFRGTLDQGLQRFLQAPGQHTAWWHSRDGQVQVIGVGRTSYTAPHPADGLVSQQTRVWKSLDGGRHWSQLDWPEHEDIDQLLFIDARSGYAIGRGPAVRRTSDGGVSWQRIALPPDAAVGGAPGRSFAGVNLGPDGTLRVAYPVDRSATVPARSVVYRLAPNQRAFALDTVLPNQTVTRLVSAPATAGGYALYTLSLLDHESGDDTAPDRARRTGVLSTWANTRPERVRQVTTFDRKLILSGLDVGRDGLLLVYATDPGHAIDDPPIPLMISSTDAGKTWKQNVDGIVYHNRYFNQDTNTLYSLLDERLRKLSFPVRNNRALQDRIPLLRRKTQFDE